MKKQENAYTRLMARTAQRYHAALADWNADRKNPFKDGRLLGWYEGRTLIQECQRQQKGAVELRDALQQKLLRAKSEWKKDSTNPFKDGRMLACFEVLQMVQP